MPHYTSTDGLQLHYRDEGAGIPVIALAGLTRNAADFDHVAPHLPLRLIRPDYRGRGLSDWADPATYTIPQEAADVLTLMDHLGLQQAAILGTSRGGLIAMYLAMTAKDRLLGAVLNDIGPVIEPAGMEAIRDYVGRAPAQKTWEDAATARQTNMPGFANVTHARWLAEVKGYYDETPEGLTLRYDPKLRDAVLATADQPTPDLWPLYDALNGLPLALIRGEGSPLLSEETADEMLRRRPDIIRADIPDRGHVPFLDEPLALDALHEWIEDLHEY